MVTMLNRCFAVPPMMWIPAQQMSVVAGSEIKLVCYVESHPEALTFWEHNGRMLQPSSRISIRNQIGSPRYKVQATFGYNKYAHWHFV